MPAPEFADPSSVAKPVGPYAHVAHVKAGSDLFFFSGQVGNRPDGHLPASIEEQADEAFANVARLLEANGLAPANIAKLMIYIVHGQDRMAIRSVLQKHLRGVQPAMTLAFVPQLALPQFLIEVECIACR